jgi:acetyl esterase/lipase
MQISKRTLMAGLVAATLAPLRARAEVAVRDTAVTDPRSGRRIRLRIRVPEGDKRAPLLLYSPGLGSGITNGAAWCEAWARAGFVVVTMAHPVTDDSLWDTSRATLSDNLNRALAGGQYTARVGDTHFVIGRCLDEAGLGIANRVDPERIGVAGHSYGAITVQALAVEAAKAKGAGRIRAVIALSPGVITPANAAAMAAARLPFLCVTGDQDNTVTFSKGGHARRLGVPLANRLAVYNALPRGQKELLVVARADHMTFAGERIDGRLFSRDVPAAADNESAWARVSAATTAFWQFHLGDGAKPSRESYVAAVRGKLGPKDRFEAG